MAKAFRRSEVVRAAVVSPKMVESPGKLKKSPVKLRYLAYLYGPVKRTGRPGCTFQQGLSEKKKKLANTETCEKAQLGIEPKTSVRHRVSLSLKMGVDALMNLNKKRVLDIFPFS